MSKREWIEARVTEGMPRRRASALARAFIALASMAGTRIRDWGKVPAPDYEADNALFGGRTLTLKIHFPH